MEIAKFDDKALSVAAGGFATSISVAQIASTWDALSHFPDRRARVELSGLGASLNSFAARLAALKQAGGAFDVDAEIARFAQRHVELARRAWAMESRCMSWFVVGPANFPTRTNQKRQASRDKAYGLLLAHSAAALKAVERVAFPYGLPGSAIRASNPDAPALIREKIESCRRRHALMKEANAAIRATKSREPAALIEAVKGVTGWSDATCAKVVQPDYMNRVGFADYQLRGELAEIKRLETRLGNIEITRARGLVEQEHETVAGTVKVIENPDAARLQIVFPGKPAEAVRAILKQNGFRWSPTEGAWQRHLTGNGRYAAERVLAGIKAA